MRISCHVPPHHAADTHWIVTILLAESLGFDLAWCESDRRIYHLELNGRYLELPDDFFDSDLNAWLFPSTLPKLPLIQWDVASSDLAVKLVSDTIPVLFGKPGFHLDEFGNGHLNLDIFGSAFFMLSRYEETVLRDRDNHDRFPATASIAYKAGFLDRPIVDEYVEILWAAMKRIWPSLERKRRQPRTLVSCDVDHPYVCGGGTLKRTILRMGGDFLIRRSPHLAFQTLGSSWRVRRGDYSRDPYLNAIDWIMEVNERAGNRVAFYFIADHSHPTLDGCYHLDEPVIRDLIRRIHARGHEIGLHASYNTYRDASQTGREADNLRQVLETEGVQQDKIGGRQHYLRWETLTTARNWETAGLVYDSTLTYADRPGFRCGTSREYPMYDVVERCPLRLRQRPLVVMECSVIADRYLGLGYSDAALETMLTLKRRCHQFGGDFTLLWHNSHFNHPKDREFYQALIA